MPMTSLQEEQISSPYLPEEGREGWLCVGGAFCALFSTFGFLNAIGVFQTTYEDTILSAYTPSEISWIFAVQLALMWAPGSLFSRLVDAYGPTVIMVLCTLLCVFSLCMTSLSREYYQIFLSQGLGFGIGAGGHFTASMICVGQWFVRRRGLATGIAMSGSSLGGVIFPIFFYRVKESQGFASAVRYTALMLGILLAMACLLVTSRLPPKRSNSEQSWFQASLFKSPRFSLMTLGSFLSMWGVWAPFDYLIGMALGQGFSYPVVLYLISIMNASSLPGRIIPAYFGDKLGVENIFAGASFLTGATILTLWLPFDFHTSHIGLIVFAVVYGFVSGAFISLLIPCIAKAGDLETLGERVGTFQTVLGLSNLTGLPTLGAILHKQNNRSFLGLQLFATFALLAGTSLITVSTMLYSEKSMDSQTAANDQGHQ